MLLKEHFGQPVIIDKIPIKLARVPVNGDKLSDSILISPRYVPDKLEHEIVSVKGYRRGRTIDVLLDEPIEFEGDEYGVMNFKGVGCNYGSRLIIHPDRWYKEVRGWIPREKGDSSGRVYGALRLSEAEEEFSKDILNKHKIKQAPHLVANPIPKEICKHITEIEDGEEVHELGQLVRLLKTNIRLDAIDGFYRDKIKIIDLEKFAEIDAQFIKAQLGLAQKGEMIYFNGNISANRFIDGLFTDLENFSLRDLSMPEFYTTIDKVIPITGGLILFFGLDVTKYWNLLEEKTGLPFSKLASGENNVQSIIEKNVLAFQPSYDGLFNV